ncbi:hypothetical protein C8R42DRAFT_723349 [Lentinula raphanica]|nr:hypothetical protein C8R42DRAFT_723349 [Lentinula raphanica]
MSYGRCLVELWDEINLHAVDNASSPSFVNSLNPEVTGVQVIWPGNRMAVTTILVMGSLILCLCTRIPAVSAHNSPVVVTVDIPANNVLVSETNDPPIPEAGKDIEADPSSDSELNFHIQPEESKDRPRPSSPWVPS